MRLTIKAGTTTTYKNGSEITENIYYQNVNELMEEFEKQKSEFKNPNVTENEIMKFAEKSQDSKRIQKLGQYEDIDENPKKLEKIKKTLEIILDCVPLNLIRSYLEKEEKDLLSEVLNNGR